MEHYKFLQVRLPQTLHEEFFRAFPGHGERSRLIVEMIGLLISERVEKKERDDDE